MIEYSRIERHRVFSVQQTSLPTPKLMLKHIKLQIFKTKELQVFEFVIITLPWLG